MQTTVQGNSTSNAALWGGRIMSGLVIVFILLNGSMRLVPLDIVISTSKQMGISGDLARPLGVIGLVGARSQAISDSATRFSGTPCSGSISACWSGVDSICGIAGSAA